jgi:hypothetical protein
MALHTPHPPPVDIFPYESLSVLTTPLSTSARCSDCALTLREIYANRVIPRPDPGPPGLLDTADQLTGQAAEQ